MLGLAHFLFFSYNASPIAKKSKIFAYPKSLYDSSPWTSKKQFWVVIKYATSFWPLVLITLMSEWHILSFGPVPGSLGGVSSTEPISNKANYQTWAILDCTLGDFTIFSNKVQHNGVKPAESLTYVGPKSKVWAKLDQNQSCPGPEMISISQALPICQIWWHSS